MAQPSQITKAAVAYSGLMSNLSYALSAWRPIQMKTEQDYRDALLEHLRSIVPDDARVEREYRHYGTTMDLYLSWRGVLMNDEVFFELKKNLKRKSDFDRLVGQIEGLNPSKNKVAVILFGDTDAGLLSRLTEKYRDVMLTEISGYGPCLIMVQVQNS